MRSFILILLALVLPISSHARVANNAYIMPPSGSPLLPTWGQLNLGSSAAVTGVLGTAFGGTGANISASSGAYSVTSGSPTVGILGAIYGGTGQNFSSSTGAISVSGGTFSAGTLSASNGGTGLSSPSANQIPLTNGSSAYQTITPSTLGNLVYDTGTTFSSAPRASIFTSPTIQKFGINGNTGNWSFTVTSANATTAAVYSAFNGETCTVSSTIASGTTLTAACTGPLPDATFTLTKISGTGDATISVTAFQFQRSYIFNITGTGSATVGAVYTNSGANFTVKGTVASSGQIILDSFGVPAASGTLTKSSGTGDATIAYGNQTAVYIVPQSPTPLFLRVRLCGSGGGGEGGGTLANANSGSNGNPTTFGSPLFTANGGNGAGGASMGAGTPGNSQIAAGQSRGNGVINSVYSGQIIIGQAGFSGSAYLTSGTTIIGSSGSGGSSPFGPGAFPVLGSNTGRDALPGSCGGGSGGGASSVANAAYGAGGQAGGYVDGIMTSPNIGSSGGIFFIAYNIGLKATGGSAGTNGSAGGASGSGYLSVEAHYQ